MYGNTVWAAFGVCKYAELFLEADSAAVLKSEGLISRDFDLGSVGWELTDSEGS